MRVSHDGSGWTSPFATLIAFMLGHFSHHVCTGATVPLLPMIRDSFELDYFQSGLLLSVFSLSYGLAQLPMAAISDRVSKRRVVSLGLMGTGVGCVGAGLSSDYVQILSFFIVMGVAGATYHAPASSFVSQIFQKETRGRSLGLHVSAGTSGLMAAPILAIVIANIAQSWRYSLVLMGLPAIAAGLVVWVVAGAQESITIMKIRSEEKAEPLDLAQLMRLLGLLVMIALLIQLMVSGMNSFLPLYLVDKHGMPRDIAGLMMGIVYGTGLVGAFLGGFLSDRLGRKPVILLSVVSAGPLIYLVTLVPSGVWLVGLIGAYGLFVALRLATMESLIADFVPARRRATVMGAYYFLGQEASGVFTPVLGWMMDQFGLNNGFAALAYMAVGCSTLALILARKL